MNPHFFQSRAFRITLAVIVGIILFLVAFRAGMAVGFHECLYSVEWGQNYEKNFFGHTANHPPGPLGASQNEFMNPNGTVGEIIKINPGSGAATSTIVVRGEDGNEKIIAIDSGTLIRELSDTVGVGDLKVDERIVVIGAPDSSGNIDAKFIRVLPTDFDSPQNQ